MNQNQSIIQRQTKFLYLRNEIEAKELDYN